MMTGESRNKFLIKNTALFALGNISTKFIHFFLVPLYTYVLTTEEYGTIDLVASIGAVITPILMCNIGEAIRRYLLDKDSNINKIRTVQYFWNLFGFIVSIVLYFVFCCIPTLRQYSLFIVAYSFTNALLQTCQDNLRGQEKIGMYTLCSTIATFSTAVLNIVFLVCLKWGIQGYFLAYIISYLGTALLAFILGNTNKDFSCIEVDKKLFKEMSLFSLMLVPNSVMWWITNSSDRLMVTYMISAAANGIYSVSYKLPSMMSTFNTILMQAWQYSAIKTAGSKDKTEYNNKMFQFYFSSTALIAVGLLFIVKPFTQIYVAKEYTSAWVYSPFLIVGLMFQTLGTFVGTSYYVEKDMKGNLISSTIGAIINIFLNFILIPIIGVTGAAIATCVSYIIVMFYRLADTKKYLVIKTFTMQNIRLTVIVCTALVFVYIPGSVGTFLQFICCIVVAICTQNIYMPFVKKIVTRRKD